MTIDDLKPGQRGVVTTVCASLSIRRRLYDMGLLRRAVVRVDRLAPFGDPIWVRLGESGTQLALRRHEAKTVIVEVMEEELSSDSKLKVTP